MIGLNASGSVHRVMTLLTIAALTAALGGCERWELDRQMEELCAKDGGIKVYETVSLPASEFSNIGQPLARYQQIAKSEEERLGPDYRYVVKETYIVGSRQTRADLGDGNLARIYTAIYRRADNKLLGEQVWYHRGGGDGFTFGHQPSGKSCPELATGLTLEVFKKGN